MQKKTVRKSVLVSAHETYLNDLERYENDREVLSKISDVTQQFKNGEYSNSLNQYNDHDLTGRLVGFRSLHLFPNFNEDVVIVYKIHRNGNHIVFHRIGDHQTVYDPDYENRFRNRPSKKK